MKRVPTTVVLLALFFSAKAQDNILSIGLSDYELPYTAKKIQRNAFSNKGCSFAFERRKMLKPSLWFSNQFEGVFWNHTVKGPYYNILGGVNDTTPKYEHTINSIGVTYTPALAFPFSLGNMRVVPIVGYKSRFMLYSHGEVFNEANSSIYSNRGYRSSRHNFYRGFDRLAVFFQPAAFGAFEVGVESDGVLFSLLRLRAGDFHAITDARYNYFNLNLRICYKISY